MSQEPSPSSASWWRRALQVGLLSFFLAVLATYLSGLALGYLPAIVATLVVLFLIAIGIAFDILGTSVTAADQSPLHAMAAKRLHGAKQALWLVRNADRVASFTNDIVGDVTGAVTGAAGGAVAIQLAHTFHGGLTAAEITNLIVISMIAALTAGGKAAGKWYAMNHCTPVVFRAGRILYTIERILGRSFTRGRQSNSPRRRST